MKALILAAGLGSRLKYKTSDRPKALTVVSGRPILQRQIDALLECGMRDIGIVLGYKGEMICDFISSQRYNGVRFEYITNKEYAKSNSSYSFWLAKDLIKDRSYIHINCDVLFSSAILKEILDEPRENVIAIRRDIKLADQMENVELVVDRIVNMSILNTPASVGKAYGLAKFSAKSTNFAISRIEHYLGLGDKNQNYFGMIREAVKVMDYYAFDATGKSFLHEVNTLDDLAQAENLVL